MLSDHFKNSNLQDRAFLMIALAKFPCEVTVLPHHLPPRFYIRGNTVGLDYFPVSYSCDITSPYLNVYMPSRKAYMNFETNDVRDTRWLTVLRYLLEDK